MFETSTACHSARGDQKKTTTLPEASTPPRCSTLYGPSGVCQLVKGATGARVRRQMAETSTACESSRSNQTNTTTLPEASTPPRCSTLYGPSGVCQLVKAAAGASCLPEMFETSTACHSARGDQKKTTTLPEASTPPRCSTLYGPSGVCQLVSGAAAASVRPQMAETSTACQSARGDQKKTTTLPEASTPPRCSTLYGPSGVCQLVKAAAGASCLPEMFETSSACQSARGDQKKT